MTNSHSGDRTLSPTHEGTSSAAIAGHAQEGAAWRSAQESTAGHYTQEAAAPPDPYAKRLWLDHYVAGVQPEIDIPDRTLPQILDATIARCPDRVVLDFLGARTTYRKLGEQIAQAAGGLHRLGVRRGDRVSIVLPNCPQHVVAYYAVLRLGAIAVEHNPLAATDDLIEQIALAESATVITWDHSAQVVADRAPDVQRIITVDMAKAMPMHMRALLALPVPAAKRRRAQMAGPIPERSQPFESLLAGAPLPEDYPQGKADDVAVLLHTGGTTGTPKAAQLTHRNFLANCVAGQVWLPGSRLDGEVIYGVLPFFHAFGLTFCLNFNMMMGATLVLFPSFDIPAVLKAMKREPCTLMVGVPPMFDRLSLAAIDRKVGLDGIRFAISGAMSLPVDVADRWEKLTGGYLIEGYGMTEMAPIALGNPISAARRPGYLGVPFPSTEIKVVDPHDPNTIVAPGTEGELLVRGPQVFPGYWQNKAETDLTLLPGGWLRTGDIVVMDDDGFVKLVDRIKEIIITGGFNVYPSHVEDHLRTMPGVADVAVIGVPSGDLGERVVAAIVLAGTTTGVDLAAVREWCSDHVARYATPRQVIVLPELPRSQLGKVLRRAVRDRVLAVGAVNS